MKLHAFPVSIESPVCTTCGEPLPEGMECPLTEKSAPWAEKFGVRCEECEVLKRSLAAASARRAKEAKYWVENGGR